MYEAAETVTLIGPRGHLSHVPVIGPPRHENQAEVSSTDALMLGIAPPVRRSGDICGAPGILIKGPRTSLRLERGVIRALRHVHMTPADAECVGVQNGDSLEAVIRACHSPILLRHVLVRVSPDACLELHLDMDEANAPGLCSGDEVELRKGGAPAAAI
jgi:propanediol utilization protein